MERVQLVIRLLEYAAVAIAAAALAGLTAIIITEVFCRFALNKSLFWANEAATYLFIYSVFFGCSVALSRGELMGIAELRDKLPAAAARALSIVSSLLILGFAVIACTASYALLSHAFKRGSQSPALEIPMYWIYLPLPVGFALMAIFALNLVGRDLMLPLDQTQDRSAS